MRAHTRVNLNVIDMCGNCCQSQEDNIVFKLCPLYHNVVHCLFALCKAEQNKLNMNNPKPPDSLQICFCYLLSHVDPDT